MLNKKFVIHLSGPSCSGKSTTKDELEKRFQGMYTVSFDKLKWQLAGYHRDKDIPLVKKITAGLFEVVCKLGIPVLLDGFFRGEDDYWESRKMAESLGYNFVTIKLNAPREVLLARFRDRVQKSIQMNTKISVTDEDIFLKNLSQEYYTPEGTPVFDTSKVTSAEVADQIAKLFA